jgi:3-dehydroquinate synthase
LAAQKEDRALIVNEDLAYPIAIGHDLYGEIVAFARRAGSVVIVSDANEHVTRIARSIGRPLRARVVAFDLGERRKRLTTIERVLESLLEEGVDRRTTLVGVGGGVASDLFGLAAALYMRGIPYAHVATSLVSMVDAAIGGKTGVNLRGGKNLAGVFSDPRAVFCDASALKTLPVRSLREGLAEIVKAAILAGEEFFTRLERLAEEPFARWPWERVIAEAVRVKTAIVADDRLELGRRELLNLGHTFAHAFERASSYRIAHGAAVALGLRAAGLLALRLGRFDKTSHARVVALIRSLGLPLRTTIPVEVILNAMAADKKKRDGRLRFVLPNAIGDVEFGVECGRSDIVAALGRLRELPTASSPR